MQDLRVWFVVLLVLVRDFVKLVTKTGGDGRRGIFETGNGNGWFLLIACTIEVYYIVARLAGVVADANDDWMAVKR